MTNIQHNSDQAPEPVGLYPHARQVGNLLFLSGVGPRKKGSRDIPGVTLDADGNIIAYNIEEQCKSVFENVRMILEASGSSWKNLVDVTVFLTNMKDDFSTYNRVYSEYFKDNRPCRTTVEINSLPTPIGIELKCIATLDNDSTKSPTQESEAQAQEEVSAQEQTDHTVVPQHTEPIQEVKPEPSPIHDPAPKPVPKENDPPTRSW